MKHFFTHNFKFKLLALFVATFVWSFASAKSSPYVSDSISVSVKILNTDKLYESGKTYEFDENNLVKLSYKVRSKYRYDITSDDFNVYVDLDENNNNIVPVHYTILNNKDSIVEQLSLDKSFLNVKIENFVEKTLPIITNYTGLPKDGYMVGGLVTNPTEVSISGPESKLESISFAGCIIDVTGLSETITSKAKISLYDINGNIKDTSEINIQNDVIDYRVYIYSAKYVHILSHISGDLPSTLALDNVTVSPETILITGDESLLDNIFTIDLPELDISDKTESFIELYDVYSVVPQGVIVDPTINSIEVKVDIKQKLAGRGGIQETTAASVYIEETKPQNGTIITTKKATEE